MIMHSINPLLKDFIFLTTQYKIEHLKVKKGQIFWLLHNYSIQQYLAGGGGGGGHISWRVTGNQVYQ